jgi:hypothetical protein
VAHGEERGVKNRPIKVFVCIFNLISGCLILVASANPDYSYALLDTPICTFNISQKIGVAADYSAIVNYAKKSVRAGMSREDVHTALEKIAPVATDGGSNIEEIVIHMCSSPLNNLVFWAFYTLDGKLVKIEHDSFP